MSTGQALSIGKKQVSIEELDALASEAKKQAMIPAASKPRQWKGPFDGKINSIYRLTYDASEGEQTLIFRARISEAFRYEAIVKEKLLFPILDGTVDLHDASTLKQKISAIIKAKTGNHVFSKEKPPVIPVQNLYAFNESKENLPYIYSVLDFLKGISLYDFLEANKVKNKKAKDLPAGIVKKLDAMFMESGQALGKLHQIEFPGFYNTIVDIGDDSKKVNFKSLFHSKVKDRLKEASKYHAAKDILPALRKYFDDNMDLISSDETPVLYHNDYQPQNFIIDPDKGTITGFIDFDNWQVSVREDDLVKMQYWGLRDLDPRFEKSFLSGYRKVQKLPADFQAKVDLLKTSWFVLVFDFEMDKIMKNERNITVDQRFPAAEKYLDEIKKILNI
nr:aminoglycoside phosphotransferase family protein [Candidatus Sigynarchaeota archaeon]